MRIGKSCEQVTNSQSEVCPPHQKYPGVQLSSELSMDFSLQQLALFLYCPTQQRTRLLPILQILEEKEFKQVVHKLKEFAKVVHFMYCYYTILENLHMSVK